MISNKFARRIKRFKIIKKIFFDYNIPNHISRNFKSVSNFEVQHKKKWAEYKPLSKNNNFYSEMFNELKFNELVERLEDQRKRIIPWINSVKRLKNLRILEIGCGNGSLTIALAEQGANVIAIEVNENLLADAKIRCEIYGLNVKFYLMNASEVGKYLSTKHFDIILYGASLEHMTLHERAVSMKATYDMLPLGGLWCIIGTPSRLHFLDSHTSHMPFFHWLPEELAIKYLPFVSRDDYKNHILGIDNEQEKLLQFYRWGRGLSYHEIEIAIKPLCELKIISCFSNFRKKENWLYAFMMRFYSNAKYASFLSKLYPNIHKGFFQPYLNLIFQKN